MPLRPVVAVVGATATGKSDLALSLALALDGEVVNADAMQVYRGMDIGTAKLSPAERRGVPHHLLDVLEVTDEATVRAYQRDVQVAISDVVRRERVPVVVGGSGLYVRAALEPLEMPPTDAVVRARLEGEADAVGAVEMHGRLRAIDPESAGRILPGNVRRVVRALEVVELTGRPFSATLPAPGYLRPTVQLGLRASRADLHVRVAHRVARMWADGLLDEVRGLAGRGLRLGRTASRAVGYAQALGELDGALSTEQAQSETVRLTRRLIRKQDSWFGRDPRIHWLPYDAPDLLDQALDVVRRPVVTADGR